RLRRSFCKHRAGRRSPKALRRCRTPGRLLRDGTVMQVRRLTGDQSATPHDYRRSISTWLGDHGERTDVIETILGHSPQGVTRTHTNRSLLLPRVAQALQRWADHLDELLHEALKPAADREP